MYLNLVYFFNPKNILHFCKLEISKIPKISTTMKKNFVAELSWRGMLHNQTPDTEKFLQENITTGYAGFDPTAPSLHIGNLVPVMLLKRLQQCGHKPIALVGGATGMIGDPSGKSAERNLLSEEVLQRNIAGVKAQLEKFLDFNDSETGAEIVNNYDWTKDFSFLEFLREVGKHIPINYMMAKDSVKNRLETGISFTEFSYQLLQGFDFYHLFKNKNCRLQIGGSDQWGNITTGTELIRRKDGGDAYAITCPLLTKTDGTKFGKSEQGNIWLDKNLTSPYKFYQFWLNVNDDDLSKLLRFFTDFDQQKIENLEQEYANNKNALKKILGEELTRLVHGQEDLDNAQKATNLLFGKSTQADFENTDEDLLLDVLEGVPQTQFTKEDFENIVSVVDLASQVMAISKGEIRRLLKNNGLTINREKVSAEMGEKKSNFSLIKNKFLLLKSGKKDYLVIVK